ncbi:hypothetical protein F2P44_33680 [Massilia sp. CCM 8695]|uniref:Ig-like domain-containing protein n=1 Tax=Massilia frigida TaxID=2609281 RepID=A0ABX0NKK9_9BURK|nr:hypothetical protein [Massilia frigida]
MILNHHDAHHGYQKPPWMPPVPARLPLNCTLSVTAADNGKADIICTIKAGPATGMAKKVIWSCGDAGRWTCAMEDIKRKYATAACPVNTWGLSRAGLGQVRQFTRRRRQPSIAACQSPGLPPCFSSTRTLLMTMPRSTALHVS